MTKKSLLLITCLLLFTLPTLAQSDAPADGGWMQIEEVIAIGGRAFDPAEWRIEGKTEITRVSATWFSDEWGAVADLDILRFSEVVDADNLDAIIDDTWIEGEVVTSFPGAEQTARCDAQGVTLVEFSATFNEKAYRLRYWFGALRAKHILISFFAFPEDRLAEMDAHAERLYPGFPSCITFGNGYIPPEPDFVNTPSPALDVLDIGKGVVDPPLWQVIITEEPNENPDEIYIEWRADDIYGVLTVSELLIDPLDRPNNVRQIGQSLNTDWFNDFWINYERADLAPECAFEANGEIWIQRDADLVFDGDDYASRTWAWFSAEGLYRYTASLVAPMGAEAPNDLETYALRFAQAQGIEGECE